MCIYYNKKKTFNKPMQNKKGKRKLIKKSISKSVLAIVCSQILLSL